jgi:hypothetical protein
VVVVPAVKVGAEATAANRRANSACMRSILARPHQGRWSFGQLYTKPDRSIQAPTVRSSSRELQMAKLVSLTQPAAPPTAGLIAVWRALLEVSGDESNLLNMTT